MAHALILKSGRTVMQIFFFFTVGNTNYHLPLMTANDLTQKLTFFFIILLSLTGKPSGKKVRNFRVNFPVPES